MLRLIISLVFVVGTLCAPMADRIVDLPGLDIHLHFPQYSGYLDGGGDNTSRNNIFYFLTEYQSNDTMEVPVLLWLNGGPGCSSLGGLMTELGPLRPNADGRTLQVREDAPP